ncbi:histidine phosphatase family protein [Gordonia soli]|uniref:Acid phosphatase n=1 Tax=Gordonia soli NBRC 108243 TaxID=1223545 RepID=M0QM26_9ACTN|nr:histidine phosphatase family protein [Gordonia soli]GAC69464.1 hypothetical protein GS4_25_00350 [Gordonia soli NBRC 108243]
MADAPRIVTGDRPAAGASDGVGTTPAARGTTPTWQGQRAAPTRLILVRHGQTPLSVDRRYSGRGNPDLTEVGRGQAAGAARRVLAEIGADRDPISAIVSSPLSRARATAEAIAQQIDVPVTVDEDLTETDFGAWEGLTFTEAAGRDPQLHPRWLADITVPAPDGESFADVGHRVERVKHRLLRQYPGQVVVVVSHVTPIKLLLREALQSGPEILFRLHLDLASVSVAEFYPDGGSVVRLVNDTSHLR